MQETLSFTLRDSRKVHFDKYDTKTIQRLQFDESTELKVLAMNLGIDEMDEFCYKIRSELCVEISKYRHSQCVFKDTGSEIPPFSDELFVQELLDLKKPSTLNKVILDLRNGKISYNKGLDICKKLENQLKIVE